MSVKRCCVAILAGALLLACGGGARSSPQPLGTEEPQPDPEQPGANAENPTPDPEAPKIGGEEPVPNGQDPMLGGPQSGGEGGASPDDS